MIFETVATGGCRSYLIGCEQSCAAALIDPELSQIDRYIALAARDGLRIRYLVDTHTHADHFSATQQLARRFGVPAVMHSASPAPFVDLRLRSGELLLVGQLRLQALRTNMTGGKTVAQMLAEAAATVPFMSLAELNSCLAAGNTELIVLDVRERDAFEAGHIPGAHLLPRGQLELRVNQELSDPTRRILVCCEFGRISTLATATLRQMGFFGAVALDGGMKAWREAGYAVEAGKQPWTPAGVPRGARS